MSSWRARFWARRATVYVNGKFLEHPVTGTERYALEVTRRVLATHAGPTVLLLPRGVPVPDGVEPQLCRNVPVRGLLFEQLALPLFTLGAMLLNLGGPAPLLKRRQLVVMHDATPFRVPGTFSRGFVAWYRLLYTVLSRTAEHLVTVSQFSAAELGEVFSIPRSRFTVAACSAEHLAVHGLGTRPAALPAGVAGYVLMLGTAARHKNVPEVARALAEAGIELVVVGGLGKQAVFAPSSHAAWAGDVGTDRLHLLGRLPDAEVVWLYRNAAAFVLPSLYEGFGIPLIEAQTAGCPVVAARSASLPEVGAASVRYFEPLRPADAVAAVREILQLDEAARLELLAAGRSNAARFSWDETARIVMKTAGL